MPGSHPDGAVARRSRARLESGPAGVGRWFWVTLGVHATPEVTQKRSDMCAGERSQCPGWGYLTRKAPRINGWMRQKKV